MMKLVSERKYLQHFSSSASKIDQDIRSATCSKIET